MTTQLLIYESVVPLTFATHRHSSVEIGKSFAFSGKITSQYFERTSRTDNTRYLDSARWATWPGSSTPTSRRASAT